MHHQNPFQRITTKDFGYSLSAGKVLNACSLNLRNPADLKRERSERPSSVASYCGGWKGNSADEILMVDQGSKFALYISPLILYKFAGRYYHGKK